MVARSSEAGISVVYPTCGRPAHLRRSIRALLDGDDAPEEIVVVDQSGDDATRAMLAELEESCIVHVPSTERGLSRARNTGIEHCRHPLIGFIDDDCVPARDWVLATRRAVDELPETSVWIGRMLRDEGELEIPCDRFDQTRRSLRGCGDPWHVGPTGGNCFFRRSVFDDVGEFDPVLGQGSDYPGAEDGDMIYRTLKAGHQVTFVATIRVHHTDWRTDHEEVANGYNYGLGVGAMLAKYVAAGDYLPMASIFARRFLSKYLAVPFNLILGRMHRYRVNLRWSQGIVHGYRRWRAAELARRS